MTQPFADKCEAIKSLLPWIFYHLDDAPHGMKTQHYGDSEGGAGRKPPEPYYVGCNGRCHTCRAYHEVMHRKPACPPEEYWLAEAWRVRRKYRIADLEEALVRLGLFACNLGQAVWAVYVEPWPGELYNPKAPQMGAKTEAIGMGAREHRAACAEDGVEWLARDLRDDVLGYGEKRDPIENQIRQLASQGFSQRRIARELRCSLRDVSRVLLPGVSTVGVPASAVG